MPHLLAARLAERVHRHRKAQMMRAVNAMKPLPRPARKPPQHRVFIKLPLEYLKPLDRSPQLYCFSPRFHLHRRHAPPRHRHPARNPSQPERHSPPDRPHRPPHHPRRTGRKPIHRHRNRKSQVMTNQPQRPPPHHDVPQKQPFDLRHNLSQRRENQPPPLTSARFCIWISCHRPRI